MTRLLFTLLLPVALVAFVPAAPAAPVPKVPLDPTKDREGNPLPKGATARLGSVAYRGPNMLRLAFSPDGKRLLAESHDDTVLIWDTDTGKPLGAKKLKSGELERVTPTAGDLGHRQVWTEKSPDGKRIVERESILQKDADGKVHSVVGADFLVVREAVTNKVLGKLEVGSRPTEFRFAGPDALIVFAAKYRPPLPPAYKLSRWNLATLEREWEMPCPAFHGLTVSADGKRFATTDQQCAARVHDARTGNLLVEPSGHPTWVAWVGFSPDGEKVTTIGQDGFRTWATNGERKSFTALPELTRGRVYPSQLGEHLVWVTYSEDGKKAELVGWDRAKGAIGWRMPVDGTGPERVLTHDGKRCVSISWNDAQRVWDVTVYDGPRGKKLHAWVLKEVQNGGMYWWPPLALSADGSVLYVGGNGVAALDVTTGKEKSRLDVGQPLKADHTPAPFPLAVSADGDRIAVVTENVQGGGGRTLRVFELKTGKRLAARGLGNIYNPGLRFSPGGKHVAVWNMWGATVQVCDAESSLVPPRRLEGGNYRAWCAAFSPNGASLVVGYQDGTALIWDLSAK